MTFEEELNKRLADKKLRLATREEIARLPTAGHARYTMIPAETPVLILPVTQKPNFEYIEIPTEFFRIRVDKYNWYWVTHNYRKQKTLEGKEYYSYGDY